MQQYPLKKRATATQQPSFRHGGHSSRIHPEDMPYWNEQKNRYANPLEVADGLDYPGETTRAPSSAIRYVDRQGHTVSQQGNRKLVIHDEPPPRRGGRRPHWLVISGLSLMAFVLLWAGLSWVVDWVQQNQLNATYEFPRISQADAVVYPGDSAAHPSHYLFLNLGGTVLIVEFPHGDAAHARVYRGPTLFSDQADQVPITGEFRVVNGKVEMLVHVQDQVILYINDGTQFKPQ
ncbi:MAG TPA: hypothetical protein VKR83_10835 [Ktedonobacteraceae bacterium]|nr:hypothetical protein [Ktedonobacteraceae bacterium]